MLSLAQQGSKAAEQGSPAWHALRRRKITGSKPSSLFFEFSDNNSWETLHDQWLGECLPETFDEESRARMAWGSEKEDVAACVLQRAVRNSIFFELPLIPHSTYNFLAASPDGLLLTFHSDEHNNIDLKKPILKAYNVEIKCPLYQYRNDRSALIKHMRKKKSPQYYYMYQIHSEMCMSGVNTTYFVMWTPAVTKIWIAKFNPEYWRKSVFMLKCFKDRCCTWAAMKGLVDSWKRDSMKEATRAVLWKEIIHDE